MLRRVEHQCLGDKSMTQQFFYKAMDAQGRIQQGQIDAKNIDDLEQRLDRMGLDLIYYQTKRSRNLRVGKVTKQELITFCFHMEQLSRAGVPLIDGLLDLRDSLPQSRFREVIASIINNIENGEPLSLAMSHSPEVFDDIFVNLIRAGEESGNLAKVFEHLTENLKWQDEMISKTKRLLMYPAFMASVIIGAWFFMMLYLVPQLVTFIKGVQAELPWNTQLLLTISQIFQHHWYWFLIVPVAIVVMVKFLAQHSPQVRYLLDRWALKIWVFGPIMEKIILARFISFFALLYRSGITVLESLNITKKLAGNKAIEEAIAEVHDHIADGVSMSESFKRVKIFPPLVLRMVRIGESTGQLDVALMNVSYFYTREIRESIEKMQTIIEPTMTVVLGLLLGWVMISVLMPIYDIISKFNL